MKATKLRRAVSLVITEQESELLDKLNARGIKHIMIFRRGLKVYAEDSIDGLGQNNNS